VRRVVALPRGARSLGDAVDAFLAQPDLAPSSRRSHGQTLSQLRYRCPPCKQILWPPLITSPIPPLPTKIAPLLSLPPLRRRPGRGVPWRAAPVPWLVAKWNGSGLDVGDVSRY
jgi:hypothetical protein